MVPGRGSNVTPGVLGCVRLTKDSRDVHGTYSEGKENGIGG